MRKLFSGKLSELDIKTAAGSAKKIIANKGFDIAPLYKMLGEVADETKIRASDVDFYIITFSLTDRRELELRAKDLPAGEIKDMLLASAYLPAFRNEKLGGKRYTDGGVRDALPLHVLIENGYKNIIAVRLNGNGIMRHVRIPDDATIYTVKPTEDLGSVLNFNSEQSRRNMTIGYYDMKRLLYGLSGRKYYIDRTLTETSAYEFITDYIFGFLKDAGLQSTWYNINNAVIPEIEMRLRVKGDYYDIMIAILEETALEAGLERYKIYTDNEFISVISGFYSLFKDKYPRFIKKIVNEAIDNQ